MATFVPTPSVEVASSGRGNAFRNDTSKSPANPPTPPRTSGPWVFDTADFISSTARSPAAVSTPASAVTRALSPVCSVPEPWLVLRETRSDPQLYGLETHRMCGIVGIVSSEPANQQVYDSLLLLQHRGQDSTGIATAEGRTFHMQKAKGQVREAYRTRDMRALPGNMGLGHVRYATKGNAPRTRRRRSRST